MYNPLIKDLSKLKDDDIELKIAELFKKYTIAAKMGNSYVCEQINVAISHYRNEQSNRHAENHKKLQEKNKDFDDLINIDR